MVSLNTAALNVPVTIVQIDAGKGLRGQLEHMGLRKGARVRVLQNAAGPLIVAHDNLRLAIGRGMSHRIFVEYVELGPDHSAQGG